MGRWGITNRVFKQNYDFERLRKRGRSLRTKRLLWITMNALLVLLLLAPVALARPGHGHGHHGKHGPLGEIFDQLTDAQKEEAKKLFESGRDLPKAEQKKQFEAFEAKLSPELQQKIKEHKAKWEQKKQENDEKVKSLSEKAQQLFGEIKNVLKDESLTRKQEHEKIDQIVKGADKSVVEELKKAGVHAPGLGHRGGRHGHGKHGKGSKESREESQEE
ncbi:unnamed protein product [Bursaphelenchus okinawaensis]|uniref:SXP/RAL-2 family protein Ani s 5-like cation-binding domain-containing protein n=1 Tax=Bursaphelenchus okinawaensis TaxID=465554 RepID=A0A811L6C9_9BILA|nr:unnamed protein product [Bursaphelenchus okinawaensis]CAG9117422.1 unnamed protein product [Bursaphelenchus okinawaensis]